MIIFNGYQEIFMNFYRFFKHFGQLILRQDIMIYI